MLIVIYHMLKDGAHFQDLGAKYYNRFNTEHTIVTYLKKLKTLDWKLLPLRLNCLFIKLMPYGSG